jgi:hypothetical protein
MNNYINYINNYIDNYFHDNIDITSMSRVVPSAAPRKPPVPAQWHGAGGGIVV